MTQKHREFGLRPNLVTRAATVPCNPCPRCGTTRAVERRVGLRCVYCSTPVDRSTVQQTKGARRA